MEVEATRPIAQHALNSIILPYQLIRRLAVPVCTLQVIRTNCRVCATAEGSQAGSADSTGCS